jgi:membrane protein DedA with SNARE-associated domain
MTFDPVLLLDSLAAQPIAFFLAVVALTLVLEDATALAAGAVAHQMRVDPVLALSAVMLGTMFGDALLHGAGRLAGRHPFIARRIARDGKLATSGRSIGVVAAARFVPGLRIPAYTGSGIARMQFPLFLAVVALTGLLWTPLLFWAGSLVSNPWFLLACAGGFLLLPRAVSAVRARVAL